METVTYIIHHDDQSSIIPIEIAMEALALLRNDRGLSKQEEDLAWRRVHEDTAKHVKGEAYFSVGEDLNSVELKIVIW